MVKYKLVSSKTSDGLSDNVNKHLLDGWELYGSPTTTISVGNYSVHAKYSQAITRKIKNKEDEKT